VAEPVEPRIRVIDRFRASPDADDRLVFLGGIVLSGPPGFGGFSGLLTEGERLLAASDNGHWLTGRMILRNGRLAGFADARLMRRRDLHGRPITLKRQGDAEALTRVPGGVLVAVEQIAQLLRYPADGLAVDFDTTPRRVAIDHPLRIAARRAGLEGLATTPDGTVIAFTEGRGDGPVRAFRRPGGRFTVARRGNRTGWSVTGADALPGGDVLIVERRYGGGIDVGMRVRRLPADGVGSSDGAVDGPVLLEADFAAEIDNMEAVAAEVAPDGRIVLTVLSDDNLSFLQRTLILRFAVTDPLPRPKPGGPGAGRS
jgi:hypothetical protein